MRAFKPQGVCTSTIPKDDFVLVVQTEFQCEMLKKYGSNAVCVDSTHGTNSYYFNLTTILVVDEYGEGVPVGWLISNKEDKPMLVEFVTAVKNRVGQNVSFMTDDAEQSYSASKDAC